MNVCIENLENIINKELTCCILRNYYRFVLIPLNYVE